MKRSPRQPEALSAEAMAATRPELVTQCTPAYRVTRVGCRIWCRLVHRLRVEGEDNVPREGGVLIVANHSSMLDIPILAVSLPRHVCFVARADLGNSRIVAWQLRRGGAVLIRRGVGDRRALGEIVAHLRAGDCVVVFPEGTRSKDGHLGDFQTGALFLARKALVPIIPAAIQGSFEALPSGRIVPKPTAIRIRYGSPIDGSRRDALELAHEWIRLALHT